MYISINKKGEIKEVGVSTNPELKSVYIADETNPFSGWSKSKICCYKVDVKDGIVMMMTPYIDSRLIEHFDALGIDNQTNSEDITTTMDGLAYTYENMEKNTEDIDICLEGIAEIYEILFSNYE